MNSSFNALPVLCLSLFLGACTLNPSGQTPATNASSAASESSSSDRETADIQPTRNVSYVGIVDDLETSMTMEGTHKLTLSDGQFILLESTDANLNLSSYLGKRVEVRGSVRPTVEGNGAILRAEEVTVLETASASSDSMKPTICGGIAGIACPADLQCVDDPSDSCDPLHGGADCSGVCREIPKTSSASSSSVSSVLQTTSSSIATAKTTSSAASVKAVVSSSASSSSSSSQSDHAVITGTSEAMAKQKYDEPSLWSQKYCTSHIGFCIPVHKNWYFKSFGATTSNLWHVEFGMESIETLHAGSIVLNLVSGTVESVGEKDGQIKTEGTDIAGYKNWTGGTHFKLLADASLKEAVTYMLSHITSYSVAE